MALPAAAPSFGGIVELSARTGRPLRTLLAEHAAHRCGRFTALPGAANGVAATW